MKQKSESLQTRILVAMLVFVTLLVVIFGVVQYFSTKHSVLSTLHATLIEDGERISESLDADAYASFMANPSKNEQYKQLREYLDTYRQQIGAMYVYTIATEGEEVQIIVDGLNEADAEEIGSPTTAMTYEGATPAFQGETVATGVIDDPEYGKYVTVLVPIKQGNEVVGVLGIDKAATEVSAITGDVLTEVGENSPSSKRLGA